jgi:hypothetical protein
MVDIDFNEPSVGSVNSTKVALEIRNRRNGGCIKCLSPETTFGVQAEGGTGIVGITKSQFGRGVVGEAQHSDGGTGVVGISKSWVGVSGQAETGAGVLGITNTWVGVHGASTEKGGHGVFGEAQHSEGGAGVVGTSKNWVGVYGQSDTKIGIWGKAPTAGYFEGNVEVTGNVEVSGDIRLLNADCAEDFDVDELEVETVEAGTVMVLNKNGCLEPSYKEYDKRVAGVISGAAGFKPGIVLDRQLAQMNTQRRPIALLGKAYCKVDARNSPIEVGDLLTTSSTKGYAMKADDHTRVLGASIGKALKGLESGLGLIPILIALQ